MFKLTKGKTISLIVAAVVIVVAGTFVYLHGSGNSHKSNNNSDKYSIATKKKSSTADDNKSSNDTSKKNGQSKSDSPAKVAQAALIDHGYTSTLIKYNGMDIAYAMDHGGPQNLAHDGSEFFYFKDETTVLHAAVGSYQATGHYTIDNHQLHVTYAGGASTDFPYHIENGKPVFENRHETHDNVTYEYEMKEDASAKSFVLERPVG